MNYNKSDLRGGTGNHARTLVEITLQDMRWIWMSKHRVTAFGEIGPCSTSNGAQFLHVFAIVWPHGWRLGIELSRRRVVNDASFCLDTAMTRTVRCWFGSLRALFALCAFASRSQWVLNIIQLVLQWNIFSADTHLLTLQPFTQAAY